jgi:hypothetical protein
MSSINNIKLSFIESKFDDFRDKLKDLSSIDDIIKLKIEPLSAFHCFFTILLYTSILPT